MNLVVLTDFDGTVTDVDTGMLVLRKFALGDWKIFDAQLERGEISLEECMSKQFALVKATRKRILSFLDSERIELRRNFLDLKIFCEKNGITLWIVSAGLDFCIKRVLESHGIGSIAVLSPKTRFGRNGIKLSFPKLRDANSINFKEDFVRYHRGLNKKVIYIGDGISDYNAAKMADFSFAVRNSNLARKCKKDGVRFQEFSDFAEIADEINLLGQPH